MSLDISIITESLAQQIYDTTVHFEFKMARKALWPERWADLTDDKRMPFYEAADLILASRHA